MAGFCRYPRGPTTYANNVQYWEHGAIQQMTQRVGSVTNSHTGQNLTQSFQYDGVNRLMSAIESGGSNEWGQSFGYDQLGNRSLLTSSTLNPYPGITPQATPPGGWQLGQNLTSASFDAATNRVAGASYSGGN